MKDDFEYRFEVSYLLYLTRLVKLFEETLNKLGEIIKVLEPVEKPR